MDDDASLLSIVIPVFDESGNVARLAREVAGVLRDRMRFELIFVDDGSRDATATEIRSVRGEVPETRLLRHSRRGGQSAAIVTGVRAARGEWVATLDGDGQNDPADIPKLVAKLREARAADPAVRLVTGNRVTRRDRWAKRVSSRVANAIRSRLLQDSTPDTGCGIKLMHRPTFLELPYFDHMHRFLPALYRRQGARVICVAVHHRPRTCGTSKYGLHNRLWVGIVDLFGVFWLLRRFRPGLAVTEE